MTLFLGHLWLICERYSYFRSWWRPRWRADEHGIYVWEFYWWRISVRWVRKWK